MLLEWSVINNVGREQNFNLDRDPLGTFLVPIARCTALEFDMLAWTWFLTLPEVCFLVFHLESVHRGRA